MSDKIVPSGITLGTPDMKIIPKYGLTSRGIMDIHWIHIVGYPTAKNEARADGVMTSSYCPLTEPERDMLVWYRLGSEPDFFFYRRPVVAVPVSREPLAEDTPAELIDMPRAA
jgi:hypothetical protein